MPAVSLGCPVAYPHRPDVPGATYHVATRGTNKEPIFFDDADRTAFLHRLALVARRYGWAVLAYCLMTNHFHMVVHVPEVQLSEGMRLLLSGYSRRTNLRYGRTMHLFRQRFFSNTVETDAELLETCRYTVLNPVRAGLCETPEMWPWSSYRGCAGLDVAPPFLAVQEALGLFGRDLRTAESAFRAFVRDGLGQVSEPATVASRNRHERCAPTG